MTKEKENLDYDQYYNPQVLLESIKTKTGMKLEELTTFINETQIILKGEEIKTIWITNIKLIIRMAL